MSSKPKIPEPGAIQEDLMTNPDENMAEILTEGQECPYCHFTRLQREGNQVVCQICGYGRKIFT